MMAQQTTEAPSRERPVQGDHSVPQASPQEVLVLEALRRALGTAGIEHDDWDFIAYKCLDILKAKGLVPTAVDYQAVIHSVEPQARFRIGYEVWRPFHEPGYPRTRDKAMAIANAIILTTPGVVSVLDEFGKGTSALRLRVKDGPDFLIYYEPEAKDRG